MHFSLNSRESAGQGMRNRSAFLAGNRRWLLLRGGTAALGRSTCLPGRRPRRRGRALREGHRHPEPRRSTAAQIPSRPGNWRRCRTG
jgi:hypothetical protein